MQDIFDEDISLPTRRLRGQCAETKLEEEAEVCVMVERHVWSYDNIFDDLSNFLCTVVDDVPLYHLVGTMVLQSEQQKREYTWRAHKQCGDGGEHECQW
jgi:hypothetical protein